MKNWKKCPLFLLLLVSGLVITGAGYAGEHSIYAAYSKPDGWMTPGLSLVCRDGRTACIRGSCSAIAMPARRWQRRGQILRTAFCRKRKPWKMSRTRRKCRNLRKHRLHRLQIMGQVRLRETGRAVYRRNRSSWQSPGGGRTGIRQFRTADV